MSMRDAERRTGFESSEPSSRDAHATRRSLVLVLAGVAIGAGLALLLTPKTGPEVRQILGRAYRKTRESLSGGAHSLRDRAQNIGEDLRERVPNLLRFSRRKTMPRAGLDTGV